MYSASSTGGWQHIPFKKTPYDHQRVGMSMVVEHKFFGLLDEMGVGKSKQIVDAACILNMVGEIDTVLVVSPAAVRGVWVDSDLGEIRKHSWRTNVVCEFHSKTKVVWGDGGEPDELTWVVTNYEFIRPEARREELKRLLHGRKFMMVLDESSFIKNRNAAQTRSAIEIGALAARRVILNGTPISNNPLDLWSQARFLDKGILPFRNFYAFRARYAVMGGWHQKQVIKWQNLDELQRFMSPYVIRREKKDCLDLPEKIYTTREVALSKETWKLYKEMRDEAVVWLAQNPSLAAQAGVRIMRLSQITSGFLGGFVEMVDAPVDGPTTEDHLRPPPPIREVGREKLDALRDLVKERLDASPAAKLIVWCRFVKELERVAESLADLLPTFKLYGDQSKAERGASIARFSGRYDETPAALLAAQPQAGGFGLNLVAADTVVYLSNDYNLMTRRQSEDRVHRPGQTRPVLYVDIIATGPDDQRTVDHAVVKALRAKDDLAAWTVSAWKAVLEDA